MANGMNYVGNIRFTKELDDHHVGYQPGDVLRCEENKKMYVWDGNDWRELSINNELKLSFYDLNKSAYGSLPAYDNFKINELEDKINDWDNRNSYFMLLCNDIRYYTVLHRTQHKKADFPDLGQGVIGLLLESGFTIHGDGPTGDYYELWVKDTKKDETYMFALFPYDQGVVNFG